MAWVFGQVRKLKSLKVAGLHPWIWAREQALGPKQPIPKPQSSFFPFFTDNGTENHPRPEEKHGFVCLFFFFSSLIIVYQHQVVMQQHPRLAELVKWLLPQSIMMREK